eukprot:173960-Prorocentrum_minimum.AAC.1
MHRPRGRMHRPRGRIHRPRGRMHRPRGRIHRPRGDLTPRTCGSMLGRMGGGGGFPAAAGEAASTPSLGRGSVSDLLPSTAGGPVSSARGGAVSSARGWGSIFPMSTHPLCRPPPRPRPDECPLE